MTERVILTPARCTGCGQEVALLADKRKVLGWLHANGTFYCSVLRTPVADWRAYNRQWMRDFRRRKRALA